jgi:ribose 5-phosphate isomerase B
MTIAVGCDHAGFPLKACVVQAIEATGQDVLDCGTFDTTSCDYPDFARQVGEAVRAGRAARGIVICGSGVGTSIAANKLAGVRAAVCHDTFSARQGVEDDDMNVLCLGARVIGSEVAGEVVRALLAARFSGAARHVRRVEKIAVLEREGREGGGKS